MSNLPETDLITAARAGDAAALEALLEQHQAQIYRFGLQMCRNPDDAREVLQDTLLAMARGVRDFRGESSLSTWLYTIARRFCLKRRQRGRDTAGNPAFTPAAETDAALVHDPSPTPEARLAGRQVADLLDQAIRALPPMYREVLVLRDVEGLSAADVARVLGITVQAVKSRLHRARVSLRQHLAPHLGALPSGADPGTPCARIVSTFSKHLEGEISADTCARMERHLDDCAHCRAACASLRQTLALCREAGQGTEVPPAVRAAVRHALAGLVPSS